MLFLSLARARSRAKPIFAEKLPEQKTPGQAISIFRMGSGNRLYLPARQLMGRQGPSARIQIRLYCSLDANSKRKLELAPLGKKWSDSHVDRSESGRTIFLQGARSIPGRHRFRNATPYRSDIGIRKHEKCGSVDSHPPLL